MESALPTCQPKVPALAPVAILPPMDDGLPTDTVDPALDVRLLTVREPEEDKETAKLAELVGAVLVTVPLRETLLFTKARGVEDGEVRLKL